MVLVRRASSFGSTRAAVQSPHVFLPVSLARYVIDGEFWLQILARTFSFRRPMHSKS